MTVSVSSADAPWSARVATVVIFLALGLSIGTWAAAVPAVKSTFGLDDAALSILLLVIPVTCVLSTMAMGVVAPRIGSGPATAAAALATVGAFALPGLADTFPQLLVCGAAIGLAAGSLEVAVNGHASEIERRWGAAIMSSFHAAFSVGGLLGASLGGLAAWGGADLRGQLWWPLALAALLALLAAPALGRGARGRPGQAVSFRWPEHGLLILGVIAMLSYLLEGAMADWSAVYLATVAHAEPWLAAAGYAAFSITMAVGRLTGDAVVRWVGPVRVLILGGVVAAAGLAIAVAVPSPWPVAVGFALVGLGAANVVPVVFSAAGRTAATPAAGIAMVSTFGFAGFLGGPPMIGAIATWAGLRVAIGVLVAGALLIVLAARRVPSGGQLSRRRSRT